MILVKYYPATDNILLYTYLSKKLKKYLLKHFYVNDKPIFCYLS